MADDYASDTSSTGAFSVGGMATGNIETVNDTDWFKTTLVAGHTYQVDAEGSPTGQGTLADPYGSIRNSAGTTKLAEADDGGTGNNTRFTYTVPAGAGGAYYLAAGAGNHVNGAGTYEVSFTDLGVALVDTVLDTTGTAYGLTIGGTIGNTIDPTAMAGSANTAFDHDWFKVNLTAGHSYQFAVQGTSGSLDVVAIQLYNSAAAAVPGTLEDNSVPLDYTATSSGAYHLAGSGKPPATLITAKAVRHINGKRSDASVG